MCHILLSRLNTNLKLHQTDQNGAQHSFQALSNQMSTLDNKLNGDLDEVKQSIYNEIKKAEKKAQQAFDLTLSNESTINSIMSEVLDLIRRGNGLFEENIILPKI